MSISNLFGVNTGQSTGYVDTLKKQFSGPVYRSEMISTLTGKPHGASLGGNYFSPEFKKYAEGQGFGIDKTLARMDGPELLSWSGSNPYQAPTTTNVIGQNQGSIGGGPSGVGGDLSEARAGGPQLQVTQDGPFRNSKDLAMYELQNNLPPSQQDGQGSQRNADYTRYNASPMSQQPQLGMLQSTPYLTDRSGMSQPAPFMSQPQQPSFAPSMGNMGNMGNMGGGMFTGNTGGMNNSFAPQWNQGQQQQQININNGPSPISGGVPSQDSGYNNGGLGQVNMTGTGNSYTPQSQQGQQMALPNIDNTQNQGMRKGANMPTGVPQSGTFKPVTFRSGTGTSTSNAGGMTTELNEPYSGLSGLVGAGSGLLGQAAQQSQQAPNQFSYNFNPEQAGQDLFNQRAALLQPQFAQQNAQAQEGMFGSGRLGLRLAGEGMGAGSGMVSPDAFGVNQAQSQALAGLAAQSTNDAFGQQMQRAGLDSNQFAMNQAGQQQQYANLMGSGQGMLQAGMQGTQLEQNMAQQQLQNQQLNQDYNLAQQNYNLAAQGQNFGQGLSIDQLALAQQGQAQDYGLNQAQFNLASQGQAQDYGLSREQLALAQQGQAQDYGLNEAQFNLASQGQQQNYGLAQQQQLQDYGLAQQNYGLAQQQQMQDYGFGMQNYGLAQQQQKQDYGFGMQDYGLNQQKLGLAMQQQLQDYEMGMLRGDQAYGLQRDTLAQNYEMGTEQNAIARMTGQAQANQANYQPDPWLSAGVGLGTAYLGSDAGSGWLSTLFDKIPFG